MRKSFRSEKASKLVEWFPGKNRLMFPILKAQNSEGVRCPLTINDRIMFAYMAWQTGSGFTPSFADVARATGLDRTRAVRASASKLIEHGLLTPGTKPVALEPIGLIREFFRFHGKGSWWQSYGYMWHIVSDRTDVLPIRAQAVYSLLWSLSKNDTVNYTYAGLSTMLGVTDDSVKMNVKALVAAKLIKVYEENGVLKAGFLRPTVEVLGLFLDKYRDQDHPAGFVEHVSEVPGGVYPEPKPERKAALPSTTGRARAVEKALDPFGDLTTAEYDMLDDLYGRLFTPDQLVYSLATYRKVGAKAWTKMFNDASKDHRKKNGDQAGDCFGLFKYRLEKTFPPN